MTNHISVKYTVLKHCYNIPKYLTSGSVGMDVYSANYTDIILNSLEIKTIPTGIRLEIPEGYQCEIRSRSGLVLDNGISIANGVGTIDNDYSGEIKVLLINYSNEPFVIERGMRIAQMVFYPYTKANLELSTRFGKSSLEDLTGRGSKGFGSTGLYDFKDIIKTGEEIDNNNSF